MTDDINTVRAQAGTPYRDMIMNVPTATRAIRPWWRRWLCKIGWHQPQALEDGPTKSHVWKQNGRYYYNAFMPYYLCPCGAWFVSEFIQHDSRPPRWRRVGGPIRWLLCDPLPPDPSSVARSE